MFIGTNIKITTEGRTLILYKMASLSMCYGWIMRKVPVFEVLLVRVFPHSDWIRSISPYSVRMRENMDRNNSEYGHSLCSDVVADKQIQKLCGEIANLSENVKVSWMPMKDSTVKWWLEKNVNKILENRLVNLEKQVSWLTWLISNSLGYHQLESSIFLGPPLRSLVFLLTNQCHFSTGRHIWLLVLLFSLFPVLVPASVADRHTSSSFLLYICPIDLNLLPGSNAVILFSSP